MSEQANDKSTNDKPANLVRWGRQPDAALYDLRGHLVALKCTDGKLYKGVLAGLGVYQLVIVQTGGLELIVSKGSVVYVHSAEVET